MKYKDLLIQNTALAQPDRPPVRIAVLSNITVVPLKEVLEFSLRSRGINAAVEIGDYDNVAQDSMKFCQHDVVVIFYELANIVDKLPFELHRLGPDGIEKLIDKAREELAFVFKALAGSKLVVFNLFSALPFSPRASPKAPLERMSDELNDFVRGAAPKSFKLISLDRIFADCSIQASIDLRFFLSSRALYKFEFLRAYSEFVYPIIGSVLGHYKKALILDCDNTLWKGVLGEDGLEGIQMFSEIQSLVVQLAAAGVVVCLCSKNNPQDVTAALNDPRMILRDEHLVLKAVNWDGKANNIETIARTLNLGLDSFVFLDDSDFELEEVRQKLPAVTALKVPPDYPDYLWLFRSIAGLFHRESQTAEDLAKVNQYKTELTRNEQRGRFDRVEDFLASLELSVKVSLNDSTLVPRLAQLTQKTNQFNLTNLRLAEHEVQSANDSTACLLVGIGVSDKFGDYGTTGFIMIRQEAGKARVENFLLSCRVIGRGIEYKVFDLVVALLRDRGISEIHGTYRLSAKNGQVRDLYEKLGFNLLADDGAVRNFQLEINRYKNSNINYIGIQNA